MHDVGDAREECMWRCAESDCMNARVRNFRAKFCAKFRENRTFRIRTLYRLREIRTLWHTAQDTLVPGPGHYGARHSPRVSGAEVPKCPGLGARVSGFARSGSTVEVTEVVGVGGIVQWRRVVNDGRIVH